jgi:hypothetical protein
LHVYDAEREREREMAIKVSPLTTVH